MWIAREPLIYQNGWKIVAAILILAVLFVVFDRRTK